MKNNIFLILLLIGFLGCKNDKPNSIDITNLDTTSGFVDVPLSIVETKELDAYFEYNLSALLNEVGLIVRLKKDIPAGFVNGEPKNAFLDKGIEFISKGKASDNLLQFIAKQYGFPDNSISLKERQVFTCANLESTQA